MAAIKILRGNQERVKFSCITSEYTTCVTATYTLAKNVYIIKYDKHTKYFCDIKSF